VTFLSGHVMGSTVIFFVSLNLDVEKRCPRDAAVRVNSVDGEGPAFGDALHGEVMVHGDQGDEGCDVTTH